MKYRAVLLSKIAPILLILFSFSHAYQDLDADTLLAWITGNDPPFPFILIDIRETNEVQEVIGNGFCSAYSLPASNELTDAIDLFPEDVALIIYCRRGNSSKAAAGALESMGFTDVYSLNGGFNSWTGPTLAVDQAKTIEQLPEPFCSESSSVIAIRRGTARRQISAQKPHLQINLQGRVCKITTPGIFIQTDKPGNPILKITKPEK